MTPDMNKVAVAVAKMEARHRASIDLRKATVAVKAVTKDYRSYPPIASPPAQDSAIRKPLRAHGIKCSGFNCSHFYNKD